MRGGAANLETGRQPSSDQAALKAEDDQSTIAQKGFQSRHHG